MFDFLQRVGFWYWIGYWIVCGHMKLWHRFRVTGLENVPLTGGGIIASNHLSHLDSPPIGAAIPRIVRFVADEAMFKRPFLNWFLPLTGGVSISRSGGKGQEMIQDALDAINDGYMLNIYPEGTRSRSGYPGRCRTGVIVIAAKTGAPIIPCRISGTYDCWPYNKTWPKPGPIQVSFGKPIHVKSGEIDLEDRDGLTKMAGELMDRIMALDGWVPKTAKEIN